MHANRSSLPYSRCMMRLPDAVAVMQGSPFYPEISGLIKFYQTAHGVMTVVELRGLPVPSARCDLPILALHIHEGNSCTGNARDPFANARTHYNPYGCEHPSHAGDLPPVFSAGGDAFSAVLTDRFHVSEILGKTVVLHDSSDDFRTQPAGDSGNKIACGEIVRVRRSMNHQ